MIGMEMCGDGYDKRNSEDGTEGWEKKTMADGGTYEIDRPKKANQKNRSSDEYKRLNEEIERIVGKPRLIGMKSDVKFGYI